MNDTDNDQGVPVSKKPGRWKRRLLIALPAAVAVYALLGFLVIPWALQRWAVPMVGEMIHGTVQVGTIKLNPFTLSATLEGVEVRDETGEPVLGLERFYGNLQASSLFRDGWVLRTVELDGPFVRAVLNESGMLNLAELLKPSESQASEPWTLPRVRGEAIAVRDGSASFEDRMVPDAPTRVVQPLTFTVDAFDSQPLHGNTHRFSAATQAAEQITWEGEVFIDPLTAQGSIVVSDFDLSLYHPYLREAVPVRIDRGKASLTLRYNLSPAASPRVAEVEIESVAVDGLEVTLAERPLLTTARFEAGGVVADAVARSVVVQRVGVDAPALVVERDTSGVLPLVAAIEGLLAPPTPANAPVVTDSDGAVEAAVFDPAEGLPSPLDELVRESIALSHEALHPWTLELQALEVSDASAAWHDESVSPAADVGVDNASLKAGPVRSADGFAVPFEAEANITQGGKVSAKGLAKPMDNRLAVEAFDASGVDVMSAVPYLAQSAPMVTLKSGTINASGSAVRVALPTGEEGSALALAFDDFEMSGTIHAQLTDVEPAVDMNISEMSLSLDGLDIASRQPATMSLAVKPNGGLITADGTVLPDLADPLNTAVDLTLAMDRLGLTAFSGYSGKYVARLIDSGALMTSKPMTVKMIGKKLDVLVPVKIEDFNFGDTVDSSDAVKLPVGLAVAILKGPDGTINPPAIPIKGDLTDPTVSVTGLVIHAFTNLVTGIVASPFQMLAGAIGGDGDEAGVDLSHVAFAPGESVLAVAETYKLEKLAEAMTQRPALGLQLVASQALPSDMEALRKGVYVQRLRDRAAQALPASDPRRADPARIVVSDAQYREAIRLTYVAQTGHDDDGTLDQDDGEGFEVPVLDADGGEVLTPAQAEAREAPVRRRLRGGRATRTGGATRVLNDTPLLEGIGKQEDSTDQSLSDAEAKADSSGEDADGLEAQPQSPAFDFAAAEASVLSSVAVPDDAKSALREARLDAVRSQLVETLGVDAERVDAAPLGAQAVDDASSDGAAESPRVTFELGAL